VKVGQGRALSLECYHISFSYSGCFDTVSYRAEGYKDKIVAYLAASANSSN
jgi:hypothetical protein